MIELKNIHAYYGEAHILQGISFKVSDGEIVSLLGRNGAGKTTTLRTVMGLTPPSEGEILFNKENIANLPTHQISKKGIGWIPDNRRIFPNLTVRQNLEVGRRSIKDGDWNIEEIYEHFPKLKILKDKKGETLSGGEQQMLSIARTLMTNPELLLLDEPSEGLAPKIVQDVMDIIRELHKRGHSILLVEQNSAMALSISERCYVMEKGQIVYNATSIELNENEEMKKKLLGI